jgi:hypothetical protein
MEQGVLYSRELAMIPALGQINPADILPKLTKLRGRSPQANYTDRATAACRRSWCQPLRVEGVAWSEQRNSHGR